MSDLILTIDVGNTRTKCGVFRNDGQRCPTPLLLTALSDLAPSQAASAVRDCVASWVKTQRQSCWPRRAVVAGSNPDLRDELVRLWCLPDVPPVVIAGWNQIPVELDVESPERVGIDRILNALAVSRVGRAADAWVVVDSGTATTIDLVTNGPVFHGGAILPGIRLSARALHDYTARLPLLDVDARIGERPVLPARDTEQAMLAGLLYGHLGAAQEMIFRLCEAGPRFVGPEGEIQVVLTGGGGRYLHEHLPAAHYVDCLALYALALPELAG